MKEVLCINIDRSLLAKIEKFFKNKGYICKNLDYAHIKNNSQIYIQASLILINIESEEVSPETIKDIKTLFSTVPIVIIVGDTKKDNIVEYLLEGAEGVIILPFQEDLFKKEIESVLRKRQIGYELEEKVKDWIELTAPSYYEYIERFKSLMNRLTSQKIDKKIRTNILLAIDEMGRNAIEWGNKRDATKNIKISYAIFEDEIVIKIEDEGEGFQHEKLLEDGEDILTKLMKRKEDGKRPGGFGIKIVKEVMDKVIYNKKGNIVLLSKRLNK